MLQLDQWQKQKKIFPRFELPNLFEPVGVTHLDGTRREVQVKKHYFDGEKFLDDYLRHSLTLLVALFHLQH